MPFRYCLTVLDQNGEHDYSLQRWIGKGTKNANDEQFARDWFAQDDDLTPAGYTWILNSWDCKSAHVVEIDRRVITRWLAEKITMTNRAKALLRAMKSPIGKMISDHARNEFGDYLHITKDGDMEITQMTRDVRRDAVYDDKSDSYSGSGRVSLKPGRFVRKFLSEAQAKELSDADVEAFSNELRALASSNFDEIVVVRGDDIAFWYNEENYTHKNSGALKNSCMRYPELCRNGTLDIYTKNPDTIGLAILRDEVGKLKARAMIWTDEDGNTIMDRVYGSDVDQKRFVAWAQSNGYYTKRAYTSRGYGTSWHYPDGSEYDWTFFVRVENCEFPKYPHIDTLCFLDLERKVIHSNETFPYDIAVTGTEGRFTRINRDEYQWKMWRDGKPQPIECPRCHEMRNPENFARVYILNEAKESVPVRVCEECYHSRKACSACSCSFWGENKEKLHDNGYQYSLCDDCSESIRATFVKGDLYSARNVHGNTGYWAIDYMTGDIIGASGMNTYPVREDGVTFSAFIERHGREAFMLSHTSCKKCGAYIKGKDCPEHPKVVRTVEVTWDED